MVFLHGHPRTHTTWHRVAPRLADSFLLVCPDLRGYGRSTLPADAPEHAQSSKRAMANDMVSLMRHFGHERFAVVGHDRGSLVAFRAAMDHPHAVTRLVVMDGLPVVERLERLNEVFVRSWWHWWFFAQLEKPAERVINLDPDAWYGLRRRPRWVKAITPTSGRPCAIPPLSTACARTTARAFASIASMKKPIAPPVAGSPARCCCWPRPRTTSTSTATPWRSGGPGGRRATRRPDPLRAPPSRTGTRRARKGAARIPRPGRLVVPPAGFEPAISCVKGRRPNR